MDKDKKYAKEINDKNKKYYEDIISLMPGHVYWKNKDGAFLGCNLEQARDAGFDSPDELIGKTDYDMPWSIQAEYLRSIDLKVMQSGKVLTLEELFELPDGTKKIYLSNKLPLYDDNSAVSGILGISFDITDRKKLEEDLLKAKEQAEIANQAKTEFLENMRHDIRTPLTGIVGFAELIKSEAKTPQVDEYADNLVAASGMLLEFLNDILEAIKVISGETPLVRRKFSLAGLLDKIVQLMTPKALEKSLTLNLSYSKEIPKYVIGDYKRIQRILLELISNALNFTDKGHVSISIDLPRKKDRELIVKCVVQDTGIGIPGDKQEEIFLRFKRLTPSYQGIYKGAGLGLAITKQFIDDIKGEIYCQSQLEQGTIFTCLFPLQEALLDNDEDVVSIDDIFYENEKIFSPLQRTRKVESSIGTPRILLVEDQDLAAKVAESIITGLGYTVDLAKDGRSALRLIQENKYNLIFMDVGLPDTNGCDLTKQIRANEWALDEHIPIIALTAHIDTENKQNCIESGMDAVLSKPLMRNTANDIINAFIPIQKSTQEIESTIDDSKEALLTLTGKVIDMEEGLTKTNGDLETANEMLSMLTKELQEELPLLIEARNNNDWSKIRQIVHKQRGGACYCGIPRFMQACARLEEYLTSGKVEWRDELYEQFITETKNLLSNL